MDKTQLETFLTIAKHKSYSKAATLLNVTQPTITARIKNLENELSCPLFIKVGRDTVLSKEGTVFFEYATNILTYMNHSKEVAKYTKYPEIRIGFSPGYSYSFITELLDAVISIDNLNITIMEGLDSCNLNEQIMAGDLDLVFTRNIQSHRPEIAAEYLFDNKLVAVLGQKHPLTKKKFLTPHDLQNETLISYRRNSNLWKEIDQRLIGISNIKRLEVDNNEMLKTIAESGLGIGITPSLGINKSNESDLVIKDIQEIGNIPNRVYVQYRKNSIIASPIKKIIYSIINHEMKTST
ncbi:LysR family transcriptional regulator [Sporosarcina sp. ACRSM]|uniref:LysR family transcriptional regulator n=1 Tax=Sporosarcina sp. ACRSM TaxID=2918216 RepID=UPI001EF6C316|nr:LysR family transcriptional regulator [Sporosarcina sp. ACRSM]MCG7336598.1 LysR family transcriptional regulator [Sporosarcina sp. ACRSM]